MRPEKSSSHKNQDWVRGVTWVPNFSLLLYANKRKPSRDITDEGELIREKSRSLENLAPTSTALEEHINLKRS